MRLLITKLTYFCVCMLPMLVSSLFDKVLLTDPTALCLDGSPGAYYISKGSDPLNVVLFFQGGGWCGDNDLPSTIQNCYQRSKTVFGSSKMLQEKRYIPHGILSDHQNNHFKNYTRVMLLYCDGSGHQGTRTSPLAYKDTKLYFRGNNITIAQLDLLEAKEGLFSKSTRIIVTGSSAGGLAALHWADYIKDRALTAQVVAVPDSGIFLDSETFDTHQHKYASQFQNLFKLSNLEMSPPVPDCVKDYPKQQYKCMMVEYMLKYIKTPIFAMQPLYDSWSIQQILNIHCIFVLGGTMEKCTKAEMDYIEQFHRNTTKILQEISSKSTNGVWAPACAVHGFAYAENYYNPKFKVPMGSMNTADVALAYWIDKKSEYRVLMDTVNWPNNKPCSGPLR